MGAMLLNVAFCDKENMTMSRSNNIENLTKSKQCSSQVFFPVVETGIPQYPFKITVFGRPIFASSGWTIDKLSYVGSIFAEFLDQDEDGCADDQVLLDSFTYYRQDDCFSSAFLLSHHEIISFTDNSLEDFDKMRKSYFMYNETHPICTEIGLGVEETRPECRGKKFSRNCNDNSIEQIFYYLVLQGHTEVYSKYLGTEWDEKSLLTDAMDIARGGRFENSPSHYPSSSWFRFNDTDCDYGCQTAAYLFWGYCAYSGMCEDRSGLPIYENEFKYMTKEALEAHDTRLYKIFEDSGNNYSLPTRTVDGKYHGCTRCSNGPGHGGEVLTDFLDLVELI